MVERTYAILGVDYFQNGSCIVEGVFGDNSRETWMGHSTGLTFRPRQTFDGFTWNAFVYDVEMVGFELEKQPEK